MWGRHSLSFWAVVASPLYLPRNFRLTPFKEGGETGP